MDKTFAELGYNVGDTVRCVNNGKHFRYETGKEYVVSSCAGTPTIDVIYNGLSASWELVSRAGSTVAADDQYLIWADMKPEAQGAFLLAEHNGADIYEWNDAWKLWQITDTLHRFDSIKYRVKSADPVVVTHERFGGHKGIWGSIKSKEDTHKLTYNTIDGVIDCSSVKIMEVDKP